MPKIALYSYGAYSEENWKVSNCDAQGESYIDNYSYRRKEKSKPTWETEPEVSEIRNLRWELYILQRYYLSPSVILSLSTSPSGHWIHG